MSNRMESQMARFPKNDIMSLSREGAAVRFGRERGA